MKNSKLSFGCPKTFSFGKQVFRGEAAATERFDRLVSLPAVTQSQKGSEKQGVLETVEQVEEAAVTCKANTHTHTKQPHLIAGL